MRGNQPFGGVQEGQEGPKCERHSGPARRSSGQPTQAPTLADDVAALRTLVSATAAPDGEAYAARNRAMAALDRIAARAPQRATAPDGRPMWQHDCGQGAYGLHEPPWCPVCTAIPAGTWRALYVLPDGA